MGALKCISNKDTKDVIIIVTIKSHDWRENYHLQNGFVKYTVGQRNKKIGEKMNVYKFY